MKKFRYSLETVLRYKEQILDSTKDAYALCQLRVRQKEEEIRTLQSRQMDLLNAFDEVKHQGAAIERFLLYASMIENMDREIQAQKDKLFLLQKEADQKKQEVITANIDVNKFEKLKQRKQETYKKAVQKEEEAFIEEFVQNAASKDLSSRSTE